MTRSFANCDNHELMAFWCDGVAMPLLESQLSKKNVNDTRKIITKAWLGPEGQDEYEMIIKFGKYSLRRYAKGSGLEDCVPDENFIGSIVIDINRKILELQLK